MGVMDIPFVRRVRRNHGIEHATIHLLSRSHPKVGLAGRSDGGGFYLYGNVPTDDVRAAVSEAIRRLRDEPELAVHPHCGTNMVVGGLVAGLLSLVAVSTLSDDQHPTRPLDVLPRLLLAGTVATIASQPLGPAVQRRFTTLPGSDDVQVDGVEVQRHGRHVIHRVLLEDAPA